MSKKNGVFFDMQIGEKSYKASIGIFALCVIFSLIAIAIW